jgi:hypothetical protein
VGGNNNNINVNNGSQKVPAAFQAKGLHLRELSAQQTSQNNAYRVGPERRNPASEKAKFLPKKYECEQIIAARRRLVYLSLSLIDLYVLNCQPVNVIYPRRDDTDIYIPRAEE